MGVSPSSESASFQGIKLSTFSGHAGAVTCIAFSPGDKLLASGSSDGEVAVWDPKTGKARHRSRKHEGEVTGVSFSPDFSALLSSGKDKRVVLSDPKTGETLHKARGHGPISHSSFSPDDGAVFATASEDHTVGLWRVGEDGKMEMRELKRHKGAVLQVCFSPDRILLASCSSDRRILFWNRTSGKIVGKIRDGFSRVLTCQFSADGSLVAAVVDGERVRIWSSVTLTLVNVLEGHHAQSILCCAYALDGSTLVTGSGDKTFALWNTREANSLPFYHSKAHEGPVRCVAFGSSGRILATGSEDQKINLWA